MIEERTLTITGTSPPKSVGLKTGWNRVGYNGSQPLAARDALSSIRTCLETAWAYQDTDWLMYDSAQVGLSDLSTMSPGSRILDRSQPWL